MSARPPIKRQYGRPSTSSTPPSYSNSAKRARLTYGSKASTSRSSFATSSPKLASSPRKRDWTNTVSTAWDALLQEELDADANRVEERALFKAAAETEKHVGEPRRLRETSSPVSEVPSEDGAKTPAPADTPATSPDISTPRASSSKQKARASSHGPPTEATSPGHAMRLRPRSSPTKAPSAPPPGKAPSNPFASVPSPKVKSKPKPKGNDIRSFFSFATAPSSSSSTTSDSRPHKRPRPSTASLKAKESTPLSQLVLDLSDRPTTKTCSQCGMSYVLGVPEDLALHQLHHSRVVNGIEWPLSPASSDDGIEIVDLRATTADKIVIVDLAMLPDPSSTSKAKNKLRPQLQRKTYEVLDMVDTALGATPLSAEQRLVSKAFLFVGPASTKGKGKNVVKGVCVVARIEKAFKVISSTDIGKDVTPSSSQQQTAEAPKEGQGMAEVRIVEDAATAKDLLRFGEDDAAVFCSPTPHPALLGIHRIYVPPLHRTRSIASTLLTVSADRFIHGLPLGRKREAVAFSQPTRSGRALARRWTGTDAFSVFVE